MIVVYSIFNGEMLLAMMVSTEPKLDKIQIINSILKTKETSTEDLAIKFSQSNVENN